MKLTLDALNVLDTIDQQGSFAAAAEALFRVPSAISYTVQKLEQDLGTPLFDRSGHRAVLTPAGCKLLQEGRHLLLAAHALEGQVKRIATGWETDLRIAVDTVVPADNLLPLLTDFYTSHLPPSQDCPSAQSRGTQIQLQREVLGGTWDALISNRADLVIAAGEPPAGAGYSQLPLGEFTMVFAVAPGHPLADAEEPLTSNEILKYRAVAIADSSRQLPPRSSGLLSGQEILTVPDMASKLAAQIQGLGIGYLPQHWAQKAIDTGRLRTKRVETATTPARLQAAWRSDNQGKALHWFLDQLRQANIQASLLHCR